MLVTMFMSHRPFLSTLPLLHLFVSSALSQDCYYPNGTVVPRLSPCNASASNSHCCGRNDICLDNGYCLAQGPNFGNRISRAGCTDQTWEDSACPYYCRDTATGGGITLFPGLPESDQGNFCCGPYNTTTNECTFATRNSKDPFDLRTGIVITNRNSWSTGSNGTNGASTAGASNNSAACSSNKDVAVGAGVGIPLGVLLLVTGAFAFNETRKKKALERKYTTYQYQYQSAGNPPFAQGPYYDRRELSVNTQPVELGEQEPRELDGRIKPREIDGRVQQ